MTSSCVRTTPSSSMEATSGLDLKFSSSAEEKVPAKPLMMVHSWVIEEAPLIPPESALTLASRLAPSLRVTMYRPAMGSLAFCTGTRGEGAEKAGRMQRARMTRFLENMLIMPGGTDEEVLKLGGDRAGELH